VHIGHKFFSKVVFEHFETLFHHGGNNTKHTYKSKQKEHKTQHKHTMKTEILKNENKGGKANKKLQTNHNDKPLDNSSSEPNASYRKCIR